MQGIFKKVWRAIRDIWNLKATTQKAACVIPGWPRSYWKDIDLEDRTEQKIFKQLVANDHQCIVQIKPVQKEKKILTHSTFISISDVLRKTVNMLYRECTLVSITHIYNLKSLFKKYHGTRVCLFCNLVNGMLGMCCLRHRQTQRKIKLCFGKKENFASINFPGYLQLTTSMRAHFYHDVAF